MIMRPADSSGDALPVTSARDLFRGAQAVAELVRDRLKLFTGDWWENPSWGNAAIDMLRETRFTEADQQTLAAYISSYIRETEGVLEVRDQEYSVAGGAFHFSCTVDTGDGEASVDFDL